MANETTIDTETARRLLLILSLEGDVKKEEIEWALAIIHQIPGYGGITLAKAVQDRALKEILVAIAAEQISPTTPKDLKALIEDAEKREAALKTAKETGEKRAEEYIEAAEKAAKTKAQIEVSPVTPEAPSKEEALPKEGFSIKVSQSFVKEFSSVGKAAAYAPLKVVSFFSPPPSLRGAVQDATATSLALTDLAAKARAARNIEEKRVFQALHDALEEAQYSAVARLNLPMRLASITGVRVTLLSGQELGLPQGQAAALLQTSAGKPSLLGTVGKGLGQRLLGQASGKLVKGFLGKAAAKLGAAAAGAPAGPPGIIAGALASFAPDLLSWLKRNASKVAIGIGTFLFGAGFVFQSPILMAGGGAVGFGGLVAGAGGFGPALSKARGVAGEVITGITSLVVASIATPLIVALISIPILVAIILFIINSGAYIVPPTALADISQSPYIGVEKSASAKDKQGISLEFQNEDLPLLVTYTIKITAKKGTLTSVRFNSTCEVIKDGSKPGCPAPKNIQVGTEGSLQGVSSFPPTAPITISPVESFIITYTQEYTAPLGFQDTFVIDTFTVTATAEGRSGEQSAASATIKIGEPPEDCPTAWPIALPQKGQNSFPITQGPDGGFSHLGAEAIDIGTNQKEGFFVTARHSGIVTKAQGEDRGPYGKHVEISSVCEGKPFFTRYAHLSVVPVREGATVGLGHVIGESGNTGRSSGPHLHYEFGGPEGRKGPSPTNPPYMAPRFIPKTVPYRCNGNCGTTIP